MDELREAVARLQDQVEALQHEAWLWRFVSISVLVYAAVIVLKPWLT